MTRLIGLLSLVAGLALLMHGGIAPAQTFPAKPVRIIVAFGPGVVDTGARAMREDGWLIPNLYAGGGTAAGISGDGPDGYLSGNGRLSALGLGLSAGEPAAAAIMSRPNSSLAPDL